MKVFINKEQKPGKRVICAKIKEYKHEDVIWVLLKPISECDHIPKHSKKDEEYRKHMKQGMFSICKNGFEATFEETTMEGAELEVGQNKAVVDQIISEYELSMRILRGFEGMFKYTAHQLKENQKRKKGCFELPFETSMTRHFEV